MCLLLRWSKQYVPGYRHVFVAMIVRIVCARLQACVLKIVKTLCARLQACVCWEDNQNSVCQATCMCLLLR